jgi:DNA polymerase-3 subunit delta
MKLTFKQIEPFVQNPDPTARVIVIYGPDQGLMGERSKKIAKTWVSDLNDPFNVVTLSPDKIIAEPSLFFDEAQAQSLMGGRRLVMIKSATDSINIMIKDYLENPSDETLVIIEAGDLGPRSPLRKIAESAKNAAALPCYIDDERSLSQVIRDQCMEAGYRIDQDALQSFSSALVGDRAIARNEIEKLLLYKGTGTGTITLPDIHATCGDVRDWTTDTLIYAIVDGHIEKMQLALNQMIKDSTPLIVMIRALQNHFWRLHQVHAKVRAGLNQAEAIKTLTPPLFWKFENAFKSQLQKWSFPAIEAALDRLNKVESLTKQSGYSDISLLSDCFLQLARYTPSHR